MASPIGGHEDVEDLVSAYGEVYDHYLTELSKPAEYPWPDTQWPPVTIGPSWRVTDDGHWDLPACTLGWVALAWCGVHLRSPKGGPWRFTLEQARLVLWWYEVDPATGRFVHSSGVIQRLKGWGKDPFAAALCLFELLGPCRVDEVVADGDGWFVIGRQHQTPWIQTAAVSQEQTKNTMRMLPAMLPKSEQIRFGVHLGKEKVYALDGVANMEAVTSNPATLEGGRPSLTISNETHHWNARNAGHDMALVISRNATKSEDGSSRNLAITNAYEPGLDSVAERDREAFEDIEDGKSYDVGIFYDSLEAHPEAPLTAEAAPIVIATVRGDSVWLDIVRIMKSVLDPREPPSTSRRFWYNQVVAAEDALIDPREWDALARPGIVPARAARIALFFDGSKSDDATALVGCDVDTGHVFQLGVWQRPPKLPPDVRWTTPRDEVDHAVHRIFGAYKVVTFWADPSETLDDATQESYWAGMIDSWHRAFGRRIPREGWASDRHSVSWDMRSPVHQREFVQAVEKFVADVENGDITHCGSKALSRHVKNARRRPNRYGVGMGKEGRESSRKIDLAVCAVGARMAARAYQNKVATQRQRKKKVY